MEKKITWKEAWHDYTTNFFRPKAPISYQMYDKHKMIVIPFAILLLFLWIIYAFTNELYTEEFYKLPIDEQHRLEVWDSFKMALSYLGIFSLLMLAGFTSELRMFNKRGKSSLAYLVASILSIVGGIIYSVLMLKYNMKIQFMIVLIPILTSSLMANTDYVRKIKKKGWQE
ncbi:hypothetical protein ERX37_01205 [Macrococcus hajekii]|uniref:Uncharacterized protein n=1 Tax=Macrococcus hajekii TaxID=198482 RepID=A0A4R6BM61_9STAP|nr:hypothetical protein [Macrococcus hajekii]TDM02737.1 hypothetical protein ERX37_01205 [Macrococcus hajekii]GGB03455.1 hypothetical protein GCM10007190_09350 [Macrococcus hajekii]